MAVDTDRDLACGRALDEVWDQLDHPTEHGRTCAHCTKARESLLLLREATGLLVEEPDPPALDLTSKIMAAVRADVRRKEMFDLPGTGIDISEQAIARVIRAAADQVPGVRARRCVVRVSVQDDRLALSVDLSVAVAYESVIQDAVDQVRLRAIAACEQRIGIRLSELSVLVEDIYGGDQ
ncbi:Asp23/Gls24 family envelope stress response protein [Pseudonocardiaceae bacterium YIM PH 21723]|nr:Asp23/Gls24 family envelope stress response protein [Pseudonocardiaceae bacterium YIM PH 21723]